MKQYIEQGSAVLGIELGSTRIKAVLIGADHAPIAGDITQAIFLCCLSIGLLCLLLTVCFFVSNNCIFIVIVNYNFWIM